MSSVDILAPSLPEPIADATVATWHKKSGDAVVCDEVLIGVETDKVILEVPASADGTLNAVLEDEGATVPSRQILGRLRKDNSVDKETSEKMDAKVSTPTQRQQAFLGGQGNDTLSLAICHLLAEHNLDTVAIEGTSVGGRLTHEDAEKHLAKAPVAAGARASAAAVTATPAPQLSRRSEKYVPMTRLRKRVVERLLETKNSTAMLMILNEVNMKSIMDLCKQYGDASEKRHGIHLGFVSFYVKAVVEVLKHYPEMNAFIDDDDVAYHNCFDASMAVFTSRGLVTPVLCDVDLLGMADIEKSIKELAVKGHDGKLTVDDLTDGNFTITSGGVFGSLMPTPIISPPQSAILGMHATKNRPMAVNGKVEIPPTMYLALSYNHRLIDGRESVGFLAAIKELLESPTRLLLGV